MHEGDLWDVIEKRGLGGRSLEGRDTAGIVIDTYVHYVSTTDQKDNYAPEDIAKMVAQQVHPYSSTCPLAYQKLTDFSGQCPQYRLCTSEDLL